LVSKGHLKHHLTVKNSVHCTDLPEENINELSYFSL
jgi:hypothetical protein